MKLFDVVVAVEFQYEYKYESFCSEMFVKCLLPVLCEISISSHPFSQHVNSLPPPTPPLLTKKKASLGIFSSLFHVLPSPADGMVSTHLPLNLVINLISILK